MATEKKEELVYHIGGPQALLVAAFYEKAFRSYIDGDLYPWFIHLQAIRGILDVDIKKEDQEAYDQEEKDIITLYNELGKQRRKKDYLEKKELYTKSVRIYQRKILQNMKLQGYFPTKKDRTKLTF